MNNRRFQLFFITLIAVILEFPGITVYANNILPNDTTKIEVRQPDSTFIKSYVLQEEFNYSQTPLNDTLFQQILTYLKTKLRSLSKVNKLLPWIFKVLIGLIILFSAYIIIKQTKLYKIFYTAKEINTPSYKISSFSDKPINFDHEITTQLNNKEYRMVIRLLYLKVVYCLKEKNHIKYSKDKTNIDYLNELKNSNLKPLFRTTTLIYNYVWYGELEISEEQFLKFEKNFQSILTSINNEE